ncbi:MAG: peptide ABC transporter substrate-binding protein [Alphaproteobacteria bacterium]|nr:peptide ABC transporter substrate-binding protein [Alphaproteobacteria bacterium]
MRISAGERAMRRKSIVKPVAILAAGLLLLAASISRPAEAKTELVIGISQYPNNFNPIIGSMLAKSYILALGHRPMTAYDADWKLICLLCTELPDLEKGTARFETTADGKPGIAVTYTLKPDLKWGDGTPVTTKDVVFTWEVGKNKKTGAGNLEMFSRITSIDVKNDRTFTLHVNKRTCDYRDASGFSLLPAHLERPKFADPVAYRDRSTYESDPTNPGLWFGPYKITSVVPGSHVVLERNSSWTGKKPAFDRITVRAIENTAALTANLLSGSIDYIAGELGLTIDQALPFEARHKSRYNIVYKPSLVYEHVDVNLSNPALTDRRVRVALLHGLDREAITQQLFAGRQPVANGQTNPLDTVYDPDVPKYPYDPKRAAALLDEAGWTDKRRGIRHNAKGERLQIEFMTTAGNKSRELVQQAMQSQWRQLGIDVRIRNEPPRVFFGKTVQRREFTGLVMYAWLSSPRNIPRSTLHSKEIPNADNGWSGQNYTGYRSKTMDKLIDDLEVVCEPKQNLQLWHDMQRLYAKDLPVLPLFFRANTYIMPHWLKGVTPTGHQYPTTLWVEDWHVKK